MHVLVHLFQPDLFVAEYFANEDSAFVPADVSLLFTRRVWNDLGYSKLAILLGNSRALGT